MLAHDYFIWWGAQIVALIIIIYLVLRWRPGFTGGRTIGEVLNGALDAREHQIQVQLDAAQESRKEAARIHDEAEADIVRAREEADVIVNRASQTSEAIQRDIADKA